MSGGAKRARFLRTFSLGLCALLNLTSVPVFASYRVYKLKLEYYSFAGKLEKQREEVSTLDPIQYENYYGGFGNIRAQLVDTWYCPGDTSRHKICEKTMVRPVRGPASNDPKRGDLPYALQPVIP